MEECIEELQCVLLATPSQPSRRFSAQDVAPLEVSQDVCSCCDCGCDYESDAVKGMGGLAIPRYFDMHRFGLASDPKV